MKVYIVFEREDYEADILVGVYATQEAAEAEAEHQRRLLPKYGNAYWIVESHEVRA